MACSSGTGKRSVRAFLKRIIGKPIGSIIPLTESETVIGRGQGCGICIPDCNVSRSHCSLNYILAGWTITDNGGVNGTYLNGSKLQTNIPAPLKDGMVIFLGPPEDSPCGFVFLQNIDGSSATNEDRGSSQALSSRSTILARDMRISPYKREANPHTFGIDHTKRFKTEYFISSPVVPGVTPTTPRRYNPKADRLLCIVGPSDAMAGPSFSIECGGSSRELIRRPTLDSLACIVRSAEPVPGPSYVDMQVDSEDGNASDCSISSLDSLRTRIQKKKKRDSRNSPRSLRSEAGSGAEGFDVELDDCSHLFSPQKPGASEKLTSGKGKKTNNSQSTKGVERSPSQQDSGNSDDSESLLPFKDPIEDFQPEKQNKSRESGTSVEQETTILFLKERVLKLQKRLLEASLELKNMDEKNKEQKRLIEVLKSSQGISQEQLLKVLEDELCCNICTEILIKPTTLNCAHTFCEHCISVWKKKKRQCPMCRESISSETGIKVLDNLIIKAVEHLDISYQTRRSEIIQSRVAEKGPVKKKGRKTRKNSQIRIQRIPNNFPVTSSTSAPQALQFPDFGRIEMVPVDVLNSHPQSSTAYPSGIEIQLSDGSDSSVEGSGFYGGFGRCYNCGRRGHWANGCPD